MKVLVALSLSVAVFAVEGNAEVLTRDKPHYLKIVAPAEVKLQKELDDIDRYFIPSLRAKGFTYAEAEIVSGYLKEATRHKSKDGWTDVSKALEKASAKLALSEGDAKKLDLAYFESISLLLSDR